MSFRFPWQSLSGKLPKDPDKMREELERRLEAIEMNFDAAGDSIGSPTFRRLYIPTEESTTSATYTTLTTPDQVFNVPMPQGGYIYVAYQAMWKETVAQAARAAIFLNSNQLKIANSGANNPVTSAAAFGGTLATPQYAPLASCSFGLIGGNDDAGANAYNGDVTTGQAVGMAITSGGISLQGAIERNATRDAIGQAGDTEAWGGACLIFAAQGSYTVSIRFKTSSGTVTAKERKLAVWTVGASSGQPA